ncbi:hypothetical protein WJX72_000731 [[Myrmecia] bisecta]|uniref:Uncharacterized protein n=1 Tax=[Myrmecia] bisecta TaxID=41462 RepID=A0AAW1QE12_9CHLO
MARRQKRQQEVERQRRLDLKRKLSDISTDVEVLSKEVMRIRSQTITVPEDAKELNADDRHRLEASHARRLQEIVMRQCQQVIKNVLTHKWAWPFATPVDTEKWKDYLNVIKQPMDLGTIQQRILQGAYQHPDQFAADMQLVFANAARYNPAGSDVFVMARVVKERFEEKWAAMVVPKLADAETQQRSEEVNWQKRKLDRAQAQAQDAIDQQRVSLLRYFEDLEARILDAKSLAAAARQPVTTLEKTELAEALAKLSPEQFEWAVSIVLLRHPGLAPSTGEDMDLDLRLLDALTVRQLQHFVRMCRDGSAASELAGSAQISWPGMLIGTGVKGFRPPHLKGIKRQASRDLSRPSESRSEQEAKLDPAPSIAQPFSRPMARNMSLKPPLPPGSRPPLTAQESFNRGSNAAALDRMLPAQSSGVNADAAASAITFYRSGSSAAMDPQHRAQAPQPMDQG